MRILTISLNAWNETLATGNSFSNFFSNKGQNDEFANIFCRNERINNNICSRYFIITERDILKGWFCFSSVGRSFEVSANDSYNIDGHESILSTSNPRGSLLRRWRPAILLFLRELIWCIGTWKGEKLKAFLTEVRPEVIYMHVHSNWYMHKLLWYCQRQTGAKVVVFSGDDVWSYKHKGALHLLYHWILRYYLRHTFTNADLVFGGSPQLCEEFGDIFKVDIKPLYKTCNHRTIPTKKKYHFPLTAVYCGNLLYGRDDILIQIARQLQMFNRDGIKLQLYIYSNTLLSDEKQKVLNDGVNCIYKGPRPYNEIVNVLNECDISLFAESFDPRYIRETRLSFSTKIIDYLQAASAILAVGPQEIASINYLKRYDLAFIVERPEYLGNVLEFITSNLDIVYASIEHKYEYALMHLSTPSLLQAMRDLI